ncbi:histidine ammonia-lyase [Nonlabens tegetincola]
MKHTISSAHINKNKLSEIAFQVTELELSEDAKQRILKGRKYLDEKYGAIEAPTAYGINTGFGSLCDTRIELQDIEKLQKNLIISHACGAGKPVPKEIIRIMLFCKIQSLSYGHSGVSIEVVERLIFFFNNDLLPVIYEQGSLGASGDLAPLAHMALPLLGLGEIYIDNEVRDASALKNDYGVEPLNLKSKEGLALINGTQFMLAYAIYGLLKAEQLWNWSHITASLSIDGFNCSLSPFLPQSHLIRPHAGQLESAQLLLDLLDGSEIAQDAKDNVQDPYSFRCVPQVHGASKDTLNFVTKTIVTELNSVTDNPNVFPDSDEVISAGNFHGQPLALALDYMAIALSEIANISERRTFQLMSGKRGLSSFLVHNPGLNSGMMIMQYTAASIVSKNKSLANPSSTDSIVSSNGQEDHVSMGANAAVKLYELLDNCQTVLGIELIAGAESLSFRKKQTSPFLKRIVNSLRDYVSQLDEDRIMYSDIKAARIFLEETKIDF